MSVDSLKSLPRTLDYEHFCASPEFIEKPAKSDSSFQLETYSPKEDDLQEASKRVAFDLHLLLTADRNPYKLGGAISAMFCAETERKAISMFSVFNHIVCNSKWFNVLHRELETFEQTEGGDI